VSRCDGLRLSCSYLPFPWVVGVYSLGIVHTLFYMGDLLVDFIFHKQATAVPGRAFFPVRPCCSSTIVDGMLFGSCAYAFPKRQRRESLPYHTLVDVHLRVAKPISEGFLLLKAPYLPFPSNGICFRAMFRDIVMPFTGNTAAWEAN